MSEFDLLHGAGEKPMDHDPQRYHRCANPSCRALLPALAATVVTEAEWEELKREVAAMRSTVRRYEQALTNILTIIDGKADASVEDGEPTCNDYASIQAQIDEARR